MLFLRAPKNHIFTLPNLFSPIDISLSNFTYYLFLCTYTHAQFLVLYLLCCVVLLAPSVSASGHLGLLISLELHAGCNVGTFIILFCLLPSPSFQLLLILKVKVGVIFSENLPCTQFQIQVFFFLETIKW